jgi:excisionase family DNA binding protein
MTKQTLPNTPFLDTQGVAVYLGVNEKQVYTLIHERGLPATKVTGKWLFPVHLVDRWVEAAVINMPEQLPFLQEAKQLLLIAGSDDPLFLKTLALFRHRNPGTLTLQSRTGSTDGLVALGKGLVHMACAHLVDAEGEYSSEYIRELAGTDIATDVAVVTFAARNQGVVLAHGNPHGIKSFDDATLEKLKWATREVGTGTRALMERELDLAGKEMKLISASAVPCDSHLDVALAVLSGQADAGIAIEAVAGMVGLPFVPLRSERFDLVIRKEVFFLEQTQQFIGLLGTSGFAELAEELGGYDTKDSGRIIT